MSPEVLATMNSSEASRDTRPRTRAQELCAPRVPEAPQQTSQSASNPRNTIPDPSDTYLAPQFQESFNQVSTVAMNELNRTTGAPGNGSWCSSSRRSKLRCERGWGLPLLPELNPWGADLGYRLIRTGLAPTPCLGGLTRPLQQALLRQQDN